MPCEEREGVEVREGEGEGCRVLAAGCVGVRAKEAEAGRVLASTISTR